MLYKDLKQLDDLSLIANSISIRAICESIGTIDDNEHLHRAIRDAFNVMVDKLDTESLTIVDTMKVNFLGFALEARLNIADMQRVADESYFEIQAELERRNAKTQTDRPAAE